MIGWFTFGLALLLAGICLLYLIANADPKAVIRGLKWLFALVVILVTAVLMARGQIQFLWFAALAILPWVQRFKLFNRMRRAMGGPSPGKTSHVRSSHLAMEMDLKSGRMDGEVLTGALAGRMLSSLDDGERKSLWAHVQDDRKSCSLLAAYFDRTLGADWRQQYEGGEGSAGREDERTARANGRDGMSRDEALAVLGLDKGASEDDIRAAHRRLMKQAHPDHGGSDYWAAKINEAKDVLLG